jgi:hypothetical protein
MIHEKMMHPENDISKTAKYKGCRIYLYNPVTIKESVFSDSITGEKLCLRVNKEEILNSTPMRSIKNPVIIKILSNLYCIRTFSSGAK